MMQPSATRTLEPNSELGLIASSAPAESTSLINGSPTTSPETTKADVISVDELTHELIADAMALGINRDEIDEEVDSIYRTLLDAIVHFDPGAPGRAKGQFTTCTFG